MLNNADKSALEVVLFSSENIMHLRSFAAGFKVIFANSQQETLDLVRIQLLLDCMNYQNEDKTQKSQEIKVRFYKDLIRFSAVCSFVVNV